MDDLEAQVEEMTPEELEEQIRLEREAEIARLEQFGASIAKKRDSAVNGRRSSGIEQEWIESEEQYQGIDDANRDESSGMLKPVTLGGSFIGKPERKDVRSTVFLNITRPYVDAAAAKVADMLLPTDDRNWGIKPTPIPELERVAEQSVPQTPQPGMMAQAPMQQNPLVDRIKAVLDQAREKAENAERKIEDWLVECQYHAEVRKVIEDCARLGTGILKGPFPKRSQNRMNFQGGMAMEIQFNPASRRIDPWNLYPDPCCGENIQNGQYVFEKDEMTVKQVRDLIGVPGYIEEQIELVLEEGPGKKYADAVKTGQKQYLTDDEKYEVWYFHGYADADDMRAAGVETEDETGGVYSLITMINDRVVKAALQPLDDGEYPYDVMPWQRRPDMPWGTGVARQVRTPQRIVNAGTRNMMDNAGISAGGQFVMRRGAVEPADGSWAITPRKIWFATNDDARVNDVFAAIQLPSMQAELMNIVQFAMKMAEDVTGMPQLLQGIQGKAPDTVGGMQMLQNNASSVLRRIARTFDDCITEPHIRRYYKWLMEYEDDESMKGDFQIDARGSTALVERDIANQAIVGLGQFVMNPAFGLSPAKWVEELLKSQRIDPKRLQLDEEEKQAMAQQQPAPAPQVMAAEIRAKTELQKTQMQLEAEMAQSQQENQLLQTRIQVDTDRDTAYLQAETQRSMSEHQARMAELQVKRELEMLRYANAQKVSLDQIKADLARDAAKINLQRELAMASNVMKAEQVVNPVSEPPGRAPEGQAFQR